MVVIWFGYNNVVSYHAAKQQRKVKECKALLKENVQELQGRITLLAEKEQEIVAHEQIRITLPNTLKSVITEFPPEVGRGDEDLAAKVT